jgi:hypothetical protein
VTKLALVLLLALAAVPAGGRPGESRVSVAVTAGLSAPTGGETATKSPSRRHRWVRWLRAFALTDGMASPEQMLYLDFAYGDCQRMFDEVRQADSDGRLLPEPTRSLYEGAAAACLAALHGRSDLWPIAGSQFDRVRGTEMTCLDRTVLRILREIVTAHRADPTVQFIRGQARAVNCPESLEGTAQKLAVPPLTP